MSGTSSILKNLELSELICSSYEEYEYKAIKVANTAEEAKAVAQLISANGIKRIVLITSSFHMPRAKLLFDKQGIDSVPFATDFPATAQTLSWPSFLRSASGFSRTSK